MAQGSIIPVIQDRPPISMDEDKVTEEYMSFLDPLFTKKPFLPTMKDFSEEEQNVIKQRLDSIKPILDEGEEIISGDKSYYRLLNDIEEKEMPF